MEEIPPSKFFLPKMPFVALQNEGEVAAGKQHPPFLRASS